MVTVSCRKTSSLNRSGTGWGRTTRRTVTCPSAVVTTPALTACARAAIGAASPSTSHANPTSARPTIAITAPEGVEEWRGLYAMYS